jgi:hypothetical protein
MARISDVLDCAVVDGGAFAGRLGHLRGGVRGPAMLNAVMSRLERRAATSHCGEIGEWDLTNRRLHLIAGAHAEDDPGA